MVPAAVPPAPPGAGVGAEPAATSDSPSPGEPRGGVLRGLLRAARPKQWIKNLLVFAAPGAAGVLDHRRALLHAGVALLAFTLVAAGCYLVNDTVDAAADRLHPRKRHRPIASGQVSRPAAIVTAVGCYLAGLALAAVAAPWPLVAVLVGYVVITLAYSFRLKQIAVLELLIVASGFVLRAGAGAAATSVPVSQWFLIVISFGALFVVIAKRAAETRTLGGGRGEHRSVLTDYPDGYLRQARDIAAAVTLLAYCLWAFERAGAVHSSLPFYQLSIVPVTFGLLRYALLAERGEGGAPEEVILGDRPLLVAAVVWLVLFGLGVARV